MGFELWGFRGEFHLVFPLRSFGFLFIGVYILALIVLIVYQKDWRGFLDRFRDPQDRAILVILGLAQILLTQLFIIQIELPGFSPLEGTGQGQFVLSIALLGSLPWMIAGGIFGVQYALLLSTIGGLLFAGAQSQGVIAAFHFTVAAGLTSWAMRNNFNDLIGKALRNPIVTGVVVGMLSGLLKSLELLSLYDGEAIYGINYLLGKLDKIIIFSVVPLILAGVASLFVQYRYREAWYKPRWLVSGPYRRSLAGQILSVFIVLGILASSILLIGDWLLAQTSAEELIETQVRQSAIDAASGIPYFFQTGRSLSRQHAMEIGEVLNNSDQLSSILNRQLELVEFFDQIIIFDLEKNVLRSSTEISPSEPMNSELQLSLDVALSGFPDEAVVSPAAEGQSARLVFLTPIFSGEDETLIGAYSGWTRLEENPFLLPAVVRLRDFSLGTGYMTEGRGRIIIHPDPAMIMRLSDVDISSGMGLVRGTDFEGQPQLSYIQPVDGFSWNVIITIPQVTITSLALELGLRLITMILIIGGVVLGVIYTIGRRLTKPLEHMVEVAESIARGNLEKSVPNGGEDEIGRLSVSFERMRSSLQSRLNEMDLLLAVSQRVASSLDLNQVLPPIMDGIRGLTDANLVRLLIAPERPRLLAPIEAYESGVDPGGWTSLDKQILELSQEKGRFILENPARAQAVFNLAQLSVGISSLAVFPILNEEQFVGCIWLGHRSPHAYSESETNLISIIASNLGVAVANARLYHSGEDERKRLGAMLEAIPDAVIVTNAHGVISLANPASQVVLSIPVEEAVGRSISDVILVDDIHEMLSQPDLSSPTREVQLADGQVFFVSVSEIEEGRAPSSGRVCVLWDISHFKKLDTLKSEFVSTVSHDLKMPLTLMKGYVTMLSMVGSMNDQQKEYLRKITESSNQMERLIDNVLDLGRIEAGLGLKLEKIDVGSIVMEVVDSYKPQAANRQVTIESSVEQNMVPIEIDRTLIRQALANLVDNAINFTPSQGRITVRAGQIDGFQRISVVDTGVGIAPTDLARLFEKFYRIQGGNAQGSLRSGLGLAIVKSIVEQHGGKVHVESRLGAGSTFTIDLPQRSPRVRSPVSPP